MPRRLTRALLGVLLAGGSATALTPDYPLVAISSRPRIDYSLGMVFFERRLEGNLVAVDSIVPLERYLLAKERQQLAGAWSRNTQAAVAQAGAAGSAGLVPTIDIPVRIPGFGEGSKIDISGGDKITFGGTETFYSGAGAPTGTTGRRSLIPELKMEQQLNVLVDGTIGRKLTVHIDHDSRRETDARNKIQLRYKGDPDEVIQLVEAGDTQLSIPQGSFAGGLPSHKGLFGLSTQAKLGPVDVFAIASREQSSGQSAQFRGMSQASIDTIYDREYVNRTYFYVPAPPGTMIDSLFVYVDLNRPYDQTLIRLPGRAFPLPDTNPAVFGDSLTSLWTPQYPTRDFIFDQQTNLLEMLSPIADRNCLAVRYRLNDGRTIGRVPGNVAGDTLYTLQMIWPQAPTSASRCWNLCQRDYYQLNQTDVKLDTFRIWRDNPGSAPLERDTAGVNNGRTFAAILGVDTTGTNRIEWPYYIIERGLIYIPNQMFFDADGWPVQVIDPFVRPDLSCPTDTAIYRKEQLQEGEGRKFYMVVRYSAKTETYFLGQLDITPNSERVTVGGRPLKNGVDYTINYESGTITFTHPVPVDAELKVDYEYIPFMALSSRSVMGVRAQASLFGSGAIGTNLFYRTEGTGEDRPPLGQEPFRRVVGEVDLNYAATPEVLTEAVDRLPLVTTDAPSRLAVSADAAVAMPDPNTLGSAYLDDFEETVNSQSVLVLPVYWYWPSVPVEPPQDTARYASHNPVWYTIRTLKRNIYGAQIGEEGTNMADVMRVRYTPDSSGSWSGLMACPGAGAALNLTQVENLEVVLRTRQTAGTLHFDYGTYIDEDMCYRDRAGRLVGPNGKFNTEDANHDGQFQASEDIGLFSTASGPTPDSLGLPGDPGNDDYNETTNPNGTERNSRTDSEDIDKAGWRPANNYWTVAVRLDDPSYFTDLANGWKLLRIPLNDTTLRRQVGTPDVNYVSFFRFWFQGFPGPDTLDLAAIDFRGSKWRNRGVTRIDSSAVPVDTTERVVVAQVSNKTDTTYVSPFRLHRDAQGVLEQEASLEYRYYNLKSGHRTAIIRNTFSKEDYREYRSMRIYVHNDANDPTFFLRFGSDSANYYEYRNHVSAGEPVPIGTGWFDFAIDLDSLPVLKQRAESSAAGPYRVAGQPTLAEIRFFALGLENDGAFALDSGRVWFDDIRVTAPRRGLGTAARARLSLTLADLASVDVALDQSDPNFRNFTDARGVLVDRGTMLNTDLRTTLNVNKFFPASWRLQIPVSWGASRNRSAPHYSSTVNDLVLDAASARAQESRAGSEQASVTLTKAPSANRLLNYTIDALSGSWQRQRADSRSALAIDSNEAYTTTLRYAIAPNLGFGLLKQRISILPQTVDFSVNRVTGTSGRYTRTRLDSAYARIPVQPLDAAAASVSMSYAPHRVLTTSYSYSETRDLTQPTLWRRLNIGRDAHRTENVTGTTGISLADIVRPTLSYRASYDEDHSKGIQRPPLDLRNLTSAASASLNTDLAVSNALRKLAALGTPRRDTTGRTVWWQATLERLADHITDPGLRYTRTQSAAYQGAQRRGDWRFRYGLVDSLPLGDSLFDRLTRTNLEEYAADGGLSFTGASFTARYQRTVTRNRQLTSNGRELTTAWPDLMLSVNQVGKLLGRAARGADIGINLRRETRENWSTALGPDQRQDQLTVQPHWRADWQWNMSSNVSGQLERSTVVTYGAGGGQLLSRTTNDTRGANLDLSYVFSAPGGISIPGLRKLRFTSDLSVTGSFGYSRSRSQSLTPPATSATTLADVEEFNTLLSGGYRFSQSVQGGVEASYKIRNNRFNSLLARIVGLNIWVQFNF